MDEQTKELCDAIESFDEEVEKIESLLEEGVDPDSQLGDEDDNASLVHKAAAQGTREIVQVLLDAGADPDVQDKRGKTPLHEAARNESNKITSMDAKIVETLLNEGLDPNAKQTEDEEFAVGKERRRFTRQRNRPAIRRDRWSKHFLVTGLTRMLKTSMEKRPFILRRKVQIPKS